MMVPLNTDARVTILQNHEGVMLFFARGPTLACKRRRWRGLTPGAFFMRITCRQPWHSRKSPAARLRPSVGRPSTRDAHAEQAIVLLASNEQICYHIRSDPEHNVYSLGVSRMTAQPRHHITEEAYLEQERRSTTKSEYYDGHVYAMTGAKESHNLIAGNLIASLHGQLRRKPCRVYPSDMRVKILRTGLNTYPDVVVVCGQPQFFDEKHDTLTNPIVIIEVLSPSTERYDRGVKFRHYRAIETLRDYILIAQDRQYIEHYTRQENGQWLFEEASDADASVRIESITCILSLKDTYEKVELAEDTNDLLLDFPTT